MKKVLVITIIAMLVFIAMPTNVQAASAEWDSFKTAITGNEGTVILTGDLVGEAEAITVTGDITLDLGGKTLTLNEQLIVEGSLSITNGNIKTDTVARPIDVKAGATLEVANATITNTVFQGTGIRMYGTATDDGTKTNVTVATDVTIDAYAPIMIGNTAGAAYGVNLDVAGTLKSVYYCIYVNGTIKQTEGNVPNIRVAATSNLIASAGQAVFAAGYANWNIEGGYFEGEEALSIKAGSFDIKGGTFYANGEYVSPVLPEYNGTEKSGSAISITSNQRYAKKVVMNIENADVISENGYAILEVSTDVAEGETTYVNKIEVNSGIYYGGKEAVFSENVNSFVNGGIYNTNVDAYVDTTLDAIKDEATGEYYVGTLNKVNVKETENGKVEVSLTEAIVEQFVEIKTTANEGYKVGTISVKDATGKEVEVVDGVFLMPDAEVTVEVTFEKVDATTAIEGELDNTPATGSMDKILVVSVIVAAIAIVVIAKKKQAMKNLV